MKDVTAMCAEGGFQLTKSVSNSKDVLVSIPQGERRKGLQDQELRLGTLPTEKAVGIYWNTEKDKLDFDVNFKDKPYTKCGMLSMVSSIYDPLGLVSPFVLGGRQIIHILSLSQLAWHDPVDRGIQEKWIKWKLSLKLVSAFFYQIFISHQMIALQKQRKIIFLSPTKLFLFL